MTTVASIAAAILIATTAAKVVAQEAIPTCDSAETEALFIETAKKNLGASGLGLEALALINARELRFDAATQTRFCAALGTFNIGAEKYQFRMWRDASGKLLLEGQPAPR